MPKCFGATRLWGVAWMDNLLAAFASAVDRFPNRVALIDQAEREITFAEMQDRSDRFAAACVRRGLGRGDRALVAMPAGIELYVALSAIWRTGAVAVFPEPALGLAGLRHAVRTARPRVFVASGWYRWLRWIVPGLFGAPLLSPSPADAGNPPRHETVADDPALISFTSGSTGPPKAISRSHAFMMAQHRALSPLLASSREDRDLVGFPLFALVNLAEGRTSVLPNWRLSRPERVSAGALHAWITQQLITRLLLPPVLCETLVTANTAVPASVHSIFTGGGPVFPDMVQRLTQQTPGLRVISVYGSTEAEPIAHLDAADVNESDSCAMKEGEGLLAGAPVETVRLRIVDHEIVVAGAHVNQGYLDPAQDRETKIREDGVVWHRTGDAGRLDDQGRLWLLGRLGEMRPTEAGRYGPLAIETAARFWRGVEQAAFCDVESRPVLVVKGDARYLSEWRDKVARFGIKEVRALSHIPMDRRHRSKIDYPRLRAALKRHA